MAFKKLKLKHALTDKNDSIQIGHGLTAIIDIRGNYNPEMEKEAANKGKEFVSVFKVFDKDENLIALHFAPRYVVAAGDAKITKKNIAEQEVALNEYVTELPDEIRRTLKHTNQKVVNLKRVLKEIS